MGQKVINMILCMLISFSCFVQWNLDETKGHRTCQICLLHRDFVVSRFFYMILLLLLG